MTPAKDQKKNKWFRPFSVSIFFLLSCSYNIQAKQRCDWLQVFHCSFFFAYFCCLFIVRHLNEVCEFFWIYWWKIETVTTSTTTEWCRSECFFMVKWYTIEIIGDDDRERERDRETMQSCLRYTVDDKIQC